MTLKSIANDEPPEEEVLVDRPEIESKVTRVTGPFVVEATIRCKAGESIASLAEDYGRPAQQIEEAIRYELPLAA